MLLQNYWPKYYIQEAQYINTNSNNNISVTHEYLYIVSTLLLLHQPTSLYGPIHCVLDHSLAI